MVRASGDWHISLIYGLFVHFWSHFQAMSRKLDHCDIILYAVQKQDVYLFMWPLEIWTKKIQYSDVHCVVITWMLTLTLVTGGVLILRMMPNRLRLTMITKILSGLTIITVRLSVVSSDLRVSQVCKISKHWKKIKNTMEFTKSNN